MQSFALINNEDNKPEPEKDILKVEDSPPKIDIDFVKINE